MLQLLDGIKVIDCASFVAGPAAATIMADFGADVVKIEPPGIGDTYRNSRGAPGSPPSDYNYAWNLDNRSKRGIELDLKNPAGREVLDRLVADADVFITNTPLPARGRLKTRYQDLAAINPRLIYASLTAYGETGPEANNTGFDSTALWARSSLMDMVRPYPDAPPARSLPGMGDHPTAVSLFAAIMAGLYRRERTGTGTCVHTSLLANGVWWQGIQAQAILTGAEYERRPPREAAANALHNLYATRDKRWFHLVLIPEDKHWGALIEAIDRPEIGSDTRFASREARHANSVALVALLDGAFAGHDWAHWKSTLERFHLTYGLVGSLRDIPEDRQMLESDVLTPIDDERAGAKYLVNSPIWVADAPKRKPALAPALGEHTEVVLQEAGYDGEAIKALRKAGAIP